MDPYVHRPDARGLSSDDADTHRPGAVVRELDGEAIERLVRDHQGAVRGFLRYLGCPMRSVEDLAQETFLTFLSAKFEPRNDRATARFLRSIARHLFLKSLRKLDRDMPAIEIEEAEEAWVRYHEEERGPYLEALRACLEGIQGRARAALDLRYGGDLGQSAIAEKMELTESGVHSLLVRARRKLRGCIEGKLAPEGGLDA